MDSEKIPITEDTVFEVGDVIWSNAFEWQIQSFRDDGKFSTLHRNTGSHQPYTTYMTWWGKEFKHDGYFLIKKEKPLLAYNPNQAGDTDDDI